MRASLVLALVAWAMTACGERGPSTPAASPGVTGQESPAAVAQVVPGKAALASLKRLPLKRLPDVRGLLERDRGARAEGLRKLQPVLRGLLTAEGQPRPTAEVVERARASRLGLRGERLPVMVRLHEVPADLADGARLTLGGVALTVERHWGRLVQAHVTAGELAGLARAGQVAAVEAALPPSLHAVTSEGVAVMDADYLHGLGFRGAGVKVGILDVGFAGYSALLGTELPASVTTRSFRTDGDLTAGGEVHGTAVAEIVHDVAPDAALVLVNIETTLDFVTATQWLVAQGVDVITSSLGWDIMEPNDGRGPIAASASAASAAGVPFFAAAGNAGDTHYRGVFTPAAGNPDLHDFGDGAVAAYFGDDQGCYLLPVGYPITAELTWNDWGVDLANPGSNQDYDLYIYYTADGGTTWTPGFGSAFDQSTQGGPPQEYVADAVATEGCYVVILAKYSATINHTLDLFTPNLPLAPYASVPAYSCGTPCVGDQVACIGATELDDTLAVYSSRGPTIPSEVDGSSRPKPEFVAPSSVTTKSYSPDPFGGTSSTTPHAAGAFALYLQLAGGHVAPAWQLLIDTVLDLGPAGRDNDYGWGRVRLQPCTLAFCDDGLACTTDSCDTATGCVHVASGEGCWIGGQCYANGAERPNQPCQVCDVATPTTWKARADNTTCEDGMFCTVGDKCTQGQCLSGRPRECPASDCLIGACNEISNLCETVKKADGDQCTDDSNACTLDQCAAGACQHTPLANGLPCPDDGNPCTADACTAGVCAHTAVPDFVVCDDGKFCTVGDECKAGVCTPRGPRDCSGLDDLCNLGRCDEGLDACAPSPRPDGTACADEGNECTRNVCKAGACDHPPVNDGTLCTTDGLSCTSDLCLAGACAHPITVGCLIGGQCLAVGAINPANTCQVCTVLIREAWTTLGDGADCEDGQYCTVGDTCAQGACAGGAARDCSAAADACNAGVCDDGANACVKSPANPGGVCPDDGSACTEDLCAAGACGHPTVANDCGARVCGASPSGCHQCGTCPYGYGCGADGKCSNLCDGVTCPECQACDAGACVPANQGAACTSDSNICTSDLCEAGTCTHPAVVDGSPCDDQDLCTQSDVCRSGACHGEQPKVCVALDECHAVGTCDGLTGVCADPLAEENKPCSDDGLDCTGDACQAGVCAHPVLAGCVIEGACVVEGDPNPDNACEACYGADDAHAWTAVDDGSPCDDGAWCTDGDQCEGGACQPGPDRDCGAAADDCNTAACNDWTDACDSIPVANGTACSDDGTVCTGDACQDGECLHPAVPDGLACPDDGLWCTSDACAAGACAHAASTGCLIGGACRDDHAVNPDNACQECVITAPLDWSARLDGTACDDGLYCSDGDTCLAGACAAGPARDCSQLADGCHVAWCDEDGAACAATMLDDGTTCDDGDLCTQQDECQAGACLGLDPVACPDAPACHAAGVCAADSGLCSYAPLDDDTACEDGLYCTVGDACQAGACVSGADRDCSGLAKVCADADCNELSDACDTVPKTAGTPCGAGASCADAVLHGPDLCDGQGQCAVPEPMACAPYKECGSATACPDECEDHSQCVEGAACMEAVCRLNQAPVADAGADQQADEGASVTLDGRASSDADQDPLSYSWKQVEGPSVTLDDVGSDTPVFSAPTVAVATDLVFELVVSDGPSNSAPAQTTVTVLNSANEAPVADAGPDQTVDEGNLVTLDGSGATDPNGDTLSWLWSLESGPAVALQGVDTAHPSFTAPAVDGDQFLVLKLVVNDGQANSQPDSVTITVRDLGTPEGVAEQAGEALPEVIGEVDKEATPAEATGEAGQDGQGETTQAEPEGESGGGGCVVGASRQGATPAAALLALLSLLGVALLRGARRGA